jgi:hypothetical protein
VSIYIHIYVGGCVWEERGYRIEYNSSIGIGVGIGVGETTSSLCNKVNGLYSKHGYQDSIGLSL